jgi:hypothetical protein
MHVARPICRHGPAALVLTLAAMSGCAAPSDSAAHDARPVPASASSAEDLDGRPVDPLAQAGEQVVVLTFVRTDCPISNRYAPTIRDLGRKFSPRGASFYLVYPNPDALPQEIRQHVEEYDWRITPLRDPHHALVDRARATITPEAAVFDRSGQLVYHGRIDDRYVDFGKTRPAPTTHDLEDAIAAALADEPVWVPATKAVGCFIADLK